MLTGTSAIAPFVFSILHNLFYGLVITFENLKYLFEALHVASFVISLLIAPIALIVGAIGSIIYFKNSIDKKSDILTFPIFPATMIIHLISPRFFRPIFGNQKDQVPPIGGIYLCFFEA